MYRSKLQIGTEILCILASNGPMKLRQLRAKVELNTVQMERHLKLLMNSGLIEKQNMDEDKIFYAITKRGFTVLKVISPLIKEAHKIQVRDFEAITTALTGAGY